MTFALSPLLACALLAPAGTALAPKRLIVGTDETAPPQVRVVDFVTGGTPFSFFAYPVGFTGGVRVALGDIDRDGLPDMATGAGTGGNAHIKVFSGLSGAEIRSFFAFPGFLGGVTVATGDVTGDGVVDLVVGAGSGTAGGHVKVFDGVSSSEVRSFLAYPTGFLGGVRVAAGDVNGDGRADIIVGTGPGAATEVRVFDGRTSTQIGAFAPYASFSGGIFVASGDLDGDGRAEIVTGTDSGAAPHVKVFNGRDSSLFTEVFPYTPGFTGGVRVALGDVTGNATPDLLVAAGPGAALPVNIYAGPGLAPSGSMMPFSAGYAAGTYVGAATRADVLLSDGFE